MITWWALRDDALLISACRPRASRGSASSCRHKRPIWRIFYGRDFFAAGVRQTKHLSDSNEMVGKNSAESLSDSLPALGSPERPFRSCGDAARGRSVNAA